jgi:hypothetical protein
MHLTRDDILVLSELTRRWEDRGVVSEPADKSEQIALWNLTAALEPATEAVFDSNYDEQVAAAKRRLLGEFSD